MMGNKSNDAIFESLEKEFTSAIVRSLALVLSPPVAIPDSFLVVRVVRFHCHSLGLEGLGFEGPCLIVRAQSTKSSPSQRTSATPGHDY